MTEQIRRFQPDDFEQIHRLNALEGWQYLVADQERTRNAWMNANAAFVLESDGEILAYVRALTDGSVTTFVCELLVSREARKQGYGQQLLDHLHLPIRRGSISWQPVNLLPFMNNKDFVLSMVSVNHDEASDFE
ncbi:MAG: GNAT family N-acetyltransferase [Exiguobacterium sp.]